MSCANVVICAGIGTSGRKEEPAVPSSLIPLGPLCVPFPRGVSMTLRAKEREPSYGSASLHNPSPSPLPSQRSDRLIIFGPWEEREFGTAPGSLRGGSGADEPLQTGGFGGRGAAPPRAPGPAHR